MTPFSSRQPDSYNHAKTAIAECYRLDELKAYANKAEAMATYARQLDDEEMEPTARKIKARALRRAQEILNTFSAPTGGDRRSKRYQSNGSVTSVEGPKSKHEAAKQAGFSLRQERDMARIGKIPEKTFEAEVERSGKPPTVTELADMGKATKPIAKPRILDPAFSSNAVGPVSVDGSVGRRLLQRPSALLRS